MDNMSASDWEITASGLNHDPEGPTDRELQILIDQSFILPSVQQMINYHDCYYGDDDCCEDEYYEDDWEEDWEEDDEDDFGRSVSPSMIGNVCVDSGWNSGTGKTVEWTVDNNMLSSVTYKDEIGDISVSFGISYYPDGIALIPSSVDTSTDFVALREAARITWDALPPAFKRPN